MFGYIRPFKDTLMIKDYRFYKSVYCSVCRRLGRKYGFPARIFLSYDTTALAVFVISMSSENCEIKKGRCCCNPLKKCNFCFSSGKAIEEAAAVNMLLAYYKLIDTRNDEGFFKKTAAKILLLLFHFSYKKAAKEYPDIDIMCKKLTKRQEEAERNKASADRAADPTAAFLREYLTKHFPDNKPVSEFGYFLGRWIYLVDAVDDLLKDVKQNNFNPFLENYKNAPETVLSRCECALNFTLSELCKAYDLLELHSYKELLDNIFYEGIYFQTKKCIKKLHKSMIEEE